MGDVMQKTVIFFFLVLALMCSCSKTSENADELINEANLLWDGKQYSDPGKAIGYLNKAIKAQPDYAETYNQRGVAYKNMGDNKLALQDFNKAISLQPDFILAHFNRGTVNSNLAQYKESVDDFSKAIELKPDFADAYNNIGISYNKLKNYKLAIENFNKAIKLEPQNASAYNNRGLAYFMLEDNIKGCIDVKKACEFGICKAFELTKSRGYCR
jgi:tetratricopeptide (TPR) repeat protein